MVAPLAASLVYGSVITGNYNNTIDFNETTIPITIGGGIFNLWYPNGYLDEYRLTRFIPRQNGNYIPLVTAFPNL